MAPDSNSPRSAIQATVTIEASSGLTQDEISQLGARFGQPR